MGRFHRAPGWPVPAIAALATLGLTGAAAAQESGAALETVGIPEDFQLGLQEAVTPSMVDIVWLHDWVLMPIITVITLFVLALLVIVMVFFNARANPTPSRTTHNTVIEVAWTVVPVLILVFIAIFSFRMLYDQQAIPEADMTLKVSGHQWYWSYEYPDHEGLYFDSVMLEDEERAEDEPRLLAVNNPVVVPVGKVVRVQVTATDVIHDWAVPAFGIKIDAVPGRLNETWFKVDRPGIYYGQCSELCGIRHAYMPIEVHAVAEEEFARWVAAAQAEFAGEPAGPQADSDTRTAALGQGAVPVR